MDGVGGALRSGQIGRCRTGIEENLVLFLGDITDCQSDCRIRHVQNDVHAVLVIPLTGNAGADIGLVLVVAADDFNLHALCRCTKILDRQLGRDHRTRSRQIGIEARHVRQHAEFDGRAAILGKSGCRHCRHESRCNGQFLNQCHGVFSLTINCCPRDTRIRHPNIRSTFRHADQDAHCRFRRLPCRLPSHNSDPQQWRRNGSSVQPAGS